jgi:hypothetical protein
MGHPLRENLEVYSDGNGLWTRCTRCLHILCRADEDWRQACKRRLLPPTKAGPLMKDLVGQFVLEQLCCPGCGALMNSDLVEEPKGKTNGRAQ